ncbi:ribonuclease H-like domain-containing protein [Tanacetum coccineum]
MSGKEPATQIAPVESPQMVSTIKLPILKKVILNGDGPMQVTTDEKGVETEVPPKTAQTLLARHGERKAKSILLLAIPDEYQLRFHVINDAKTLWAAIKSRFGGNVESKKMQKNVLKQQFENFYVSDTEGLDKKFLRALPSSWNNVALIMRNKDGIDDLDIDDLYNNLKVFEADIKGSSRSSSNSQNVAFLSAEDTSNSNEVNTTNGVSTALGHNSQGQASSSSYTNDLMFSFFANQSNSPQLDDEDLEQIDHDDLEEMDLKWQVAMLSMRKSRNRNGDAIWYRSKATHKTVPVGEPLKHGCSDNALIVQDRLDMSKILTRFGRIPVSVAKQSSLRATSSTSTFRPVNTDTHTNRVNVSNLRTNAFHKSNSPIRRPFYKSTTSNTRISNEKVNAVRVNGVNTAGQTTVSTVKRTRVTVVKASAGYVWRPKMTDLNNVSKDNSGSWVSKRESPQALKNKGIFDSGCSRHMTANKPFLADYQELDGGFAAFGGSPKGGKITGKGKIRTDKIKREFSVARTPQQNGVAERKNRTLIEAARTMLADSLLPTELVNAASAPRSFNDAGPSFVPLGGSFPLNVNDLPDDPLMPDLENIVEVYVSQPPGFVDPEFTEKVYKVEIALYGLHQAPRAWYETLSTYLLDNGFYRGQIDKTLFIKRVKGDILLVQVYVDDIIFGSTKKSLCTNFEQIMHKRFQVSSLGELTFFLGLQVKQKEDEIFISQDKYVGEILKKFGFSSIRTTSTPMETNKALTKDEDGEDVDVHLYKSMIGSLMYLTSSRTDIMFSVCACSRFQVQPKVFHLNAVKRIFRMRGKH